MAFETKMETAADTVAWPATLCEAFQRTAATFADGVATMRTELAELWRPVEVVRRIAGNRKCSFGRVAD